MTSIDETLDEVAGYKGITTRINLQSADWLAFRLARDAAFKKLGAPATSHQGSEMGWLTWRIDDITLQLWTPTYRAPKPTGNEPPEDLDELLAVPDAD